METARALWIGGAVSTAGASGAALGPGIGRIAAIAPQRNEPATALPGQLVGPYHPYPVRSHGQVFLEFPGDTRTGAGAGLEVCYQAISPAHGELLSRVANTRVTPYRKLQNWEFRTAAARDRLPFLEGKENVRRCADRNESSAAERGSVLLRG